MAFRNIKKAPVMKPFLQYQIRNPGLENCNVARLKTFGTAFNVEFNFLTFLQCAETVRLDGGVMDKNVFTFRLGKEAIAL